MNIKNNKSLLHPISGTGRSLHLHEVFEMLLSNSHTMISIPKSINPKFLKKDNWWGIENAQKDISNQSVTLYTLIEGDLLCRHVLTAAKL